MMDHVLRFADEAAARAALPDFWQEIEGFGGGWRADCVLADVIVYTVTGVEIIQTPTGPLEVETRTLFPGWFMVIAQRRLNAALRDLPDIACRVIVDRNAAIAGSPDFIRYAAPDLSAETIATARVSPTFAGSAYPTGDE